MVLCNMKGYYHQLLSLLSVWLFFSRTLSTSTARSLSAWCHSLPMLTRRLSAQSSQGSSLMCSSLETTSSAVEPLAPGCTSSSMGWWISSPRMARWLHASAMVHSLEVSCMPQWCILSIELFHTDPALVCTNICGREWIYLQFLRVGQDSIQFFRV